MQTTVIYGATLTLLTALLLSDLNGYGAELRELLCTLVPSLAFSKADRGWYLLHHLGGSGPWIPYESDQDHRCPLPDNCVVTQAHMISRHAERYPTLNAGRRHMTLLQKLAGAKDQLQGSLLFARDWSYFVDSEAPQFERLTTTGQYAGTLQAFTSGQKLRELYDHLVPKGRAVSFWTCSSPRDIETARHYADGFFGPGWEADGRAILHTIPETYERGADTLTPGRSCRNYRRDQEMGRDVGYKKLKEFQIFMARSINDRLRTDAAGLNFTPLEVYGMMEFCGFELLVRGSSPWCDVFTQDEWLQYEYARDLLHFYRSGPANQYAGALGWLWLNATTEQLVNKSAGGIYHSFVHDGDIIPLLATLGIFNEDGPTQFLPTDLVKHDRRWKTSNIVPMGGKLIFEKLDCMKEGSDIDVAASYVRLIVNDGLLDLGQFINGERVAYGIELNAFQDWVGQKGEKFGDFRTNCGIGNDMPARISFLHQ